MATGYVVSKSGARIIDIVPNIKEIDGNNMSGDGKKVIGVNRQMADFWVIDAKLEVQPGDVFPGGHQNVADRYIKKPSDEKSQVDELASKLQASENGRVALENQYMSLVMALTMKGVL